MSVPAAFFDLDGTLLTVNSARLWLRRERRVGRVGAWQVARAALRLGAYRVGLLDMADTLRRARHVLGDGGGRHPRRDPGVVAR